MDALLLISLASGCVWFAYLIFILRRSNNKGRFVGHRLMLGLSLWATTYALLIGLYPDFLKLGISIDALKHGFILFFLASVIEKGNDELAWVKPASTLICLTMVLSILAPIVGINTAVIFAFVGIAACLLQFVLVERLYQLSRLHSKAYHTLVVSLGGITLVDFALYCEMTLMQTVAIHQIEWRGVVLLTLLPFVWKGLNALQRTPLKISISKPLAFHGALFMLSGLYLLIISTAGYYVQSSNLGMTYTTLLVMGGAGCLPLLLVLSSQRIRREIFVWVNKHLFASQFDYRTTWLTLIEELSPDLSGKEAYEQGLKTVLEAINHQNGAYYKVNATSSVQLLSSLGMNLSPKAEQAITRLLPYLHQTGWVVDVEEAVSFPDQYPDLNIDITHVLKSGVKWLVPVVRDEALRSILVIGAAPSKDWDLNWETRDFLLSLSHQLERYFFSQETQQTLSEHAQLAAFHQTSAFVIHDLKNVHAQMKMLIKNGEKHRNNPDFINDLFITMSSMQTRVEKTLSQLTNKQRDPVFAKERKIDAALTLSNSLRETHPDINVVYEKQEDFSITVDADRFSNVVKHLVDNAKHACEKNNTVDISVSCIIKSNYVMINVKDNGVGMTQEFMSTKLFHPFETTKGNSGMGLGVYDAKTFAENHNGHIEVKSEIGKGSVFTLIIPRSGNSEVIDS